MACCGLAVCARVTDLRNFAASTASRRVHRQLRVGRHLRTVPPESSRGRRLPAACFRLGLRIPGRPRPLSQRRRDRVSDRRRRSHRPLLRCSGSFAVVKRQIDIRTGSRRWSSVGDSFSNNGHGWPLRTLAPSLRVSRPDRVTVAASPVP